MNRTCEWRPSPIFSEHYEISNDGKVRNKRGKLLRPSTDKDGYLYYVLCVRGVRKTIKAHRLVALVYISNPQNKPAVDHINGIRTDNRVDNLRWVTNKENTNNPNTFANFKAVCSKRLPAMYEASRKQGFGRKKVKVIWTDGRTEIYCSLKIAAKELGENYSKLSEKINGHRPQRKEYTAVWASEA